MLCQVCPSEVPAVVQQATAAEPSMPFCDEVANAQAAARLCAPLGPAVCGRATMRMQTVIHLCFERPTSTVYNL